MSKGCRQSFGNILQGSSSYVRILVVDDESYAADALAILLRAQGYEVIVAHDGATGIATGVAGHFDAAVLDLGMDTVTGFDVARALRAKHGSGIRLIAYTGFSSAGVQRRAYDNGFDRVIVKPATLDLIVTALTEPTIKPLGRPSD
jgi:DNA-binding response OmpR family regulator